MTIFSSKGLVSGIVMVLGLAGGLYYLSSGDKPGEIGENEGRFRRVIIDTAGPRDPWGKSVGDIDGDGLLDLLVGGAWVC